MRAEGLRPSPLGILIHPQYGLWQAFRGALLFDRALDFASGGPQRHPCDDCQDKPCLSPCPVNAFSDGGYDVVRCRSHLASGEGNECLSGGCLARRACPVGHEYAYGAPQMRFHMKAFAKG
jgi:epoxyqueuosine reductase QueG